MKKVLAVDDDEGVRRAMTIHLKGAYEVTTAATCAEGIALGSTGNFDLILCDLKLPDMSGVEMIKALKTKNIGTPIIVVSGFIDTLMVEGAKGAGAAAYLPKPFLKKTLLDTMAKVLRGEGDRD